jgi:hypothetical protein
VDQVASKLKEVSLRNLLGAVYTPILQEMGHPKAITTSLEARTDITANTMTTTVVAEAREMEEA